MKCEDVALHSTISQAKILERGGRTAASEEAGFHSNDETSVPFGPSGTTYSVGCNRKRESCRHVEQ